MVAKVSPYCYNLTYHYFTLFGMITILKNIVRACFDKSFYVESQKDSFGRRFAHLYVLYFIVIVVSSLSIVNWYISERATIGMLPTRISQAVKELYPRDLVLRFENDELSINQPEPYVIPLPPQIAEVLGDDKPVTTDLVTIDTTASVDDFSSYDTDILATRKGVAVRGQNGKVEYYQYTEMLREVRQPFTFDIVSYTQIVNKAKPFIDALPAIIGYVLVMAGLFVLFVAPLIFVLGTLIFLLLLSLVGYLVASLIQRKHSYGYMYKLGMYSMIPIIILQEVVAKTTTLDLSNVWWLVALLLMVVFVPTGKETTGVTPPQPAGIHPPKIT